MVHPLWTDSCKHVCHAAVFGWEIKIFLLAVESVRQTTLSKRALEVEVVHKLLFAVLEPVQTAKFLTWMRRIVVLPICQWKEWMRLIYPCILGADR